MVTPWPTFKWELSKSLGILDWTYEGGRRLERWV